MEAVRQWALRICICCALTGVMQLLLPQKGSAKVIKTVLALYILVSVLPKGETIGWSAVRQQLETPLQTVTPALDGDAGAMIRQTALEALQSRLTLCLALQHISAQVTVVQDDSAQGDDAAGFLVTVLLQDRDKADEAEAILQQELNGNGSIICRGTDGLP